VALKVPVIPDRAKTWEKARAGMFGLAASLRVLDSKRMKYSVAEGPIDGSGVKRRN